MSDNKKFTCPQCDSAVEKDFKFCPECGISLNENLLDMLLRQITNLQSHGKIWDAMEQLKELTQLHPDNAYIHKLLGNAYFHMGLIDWAIDAYTKAIEHDAKYLDAHYDLGVALYHRARVKEAIAAFLKVLELDPDYHSAHYRIGLCYHHAGQLNAAIHHLLEATVVTPDFVMAFYHLGVIYYKQGEFEKAKNAFKRVLDEDPHDTASAKYLELISKPIEQS